MTVEGEPDCWRRLPTVGRALLRPDLFLAMMSTARSAAAGWSSPTPRAAPDVSTPTSSASAARRRGTAAPTINDQATGGYWAVCGLIAGAGLVMALSQLL